MEDRDVVAKRAQPAHRPLHFPWFHQQIGDQHDHAAAVDEPCRLRERDRRARRQARARLLERSQDAPPMTGASARRHRATHALVETDQAYRVALTEKQQCQ